MAEFRPNEDFVGFSYAGDHGEYLHSIRDLGIYRTSNSNRFTVNLGANRKLVTAEIPGGDGSFYFGFNKTEMPIDITFAFDCLTELQITRLRTVFSKDACGGLIFDELPFKEYPVVLKQPIQLKFLPFTENGERVYKGEGELHFVNYSCYAHSPNWVWTKTADGFIIPTVKDGRNPDEYDATIYNSKDEWDDLLPWEENVSQGSADVVNYGEIPAYFKIQGTSTIKDGDDGNIKVFEGRENEVIIPLGTGTWNWTWDTRLGIVTKTDGSNKPVLVGAKGNLTQTIPIGRAPTYLGDIPDGSSVIYNFLYY